MNSKELIDIIAKLGITGTWLREDKWWSYGQVKQVAQEYAKEILENYNNWKAHKTPDLVKQYIKEKGL